MSPARVLPELVEVVLAEHVGVEEVGLAVTLAGTVTTPAAPVQKLLTAGPSQAGPVSGLWEDVAPLPLLVCAVVARTVGQRLKPRKL